MEEKISFPLKWIVIDLSKSTPKHKDFFSQSFRQEKQAKIAIKLHLNSSKHKVWVSQIRGALCLETQPISYFLKLTKAKNLANSLLPSCKK